MTRRQYMSGLFGAGRALWARLTRGCSEPRVGRHEGDLGVVGALGLVLELLELLVEHAHEAGPLLTRAGEVEDHRHLIVRADDPARHDAVLEVLRVNSVGASRHSTHHTFDLVLEAVDLLEDAEAPTQAELDLTVVGLHLGVDELGGVVLDGLLVHDDSFLSKWFARLLL